MSLRRRVENLETAIGGEQDEQLLIKVGFVAEVAENEHDRLPPKGQMKIRVILPPDLEAHRDHEAARCP